MDTIFIAIVSVTVIGIVCAAILSMASKVMHVEVDERVAQIRDVLPGVNCGACGYPGCSGFAAALVADAGIKVSLCTPAGPEVVEKVSAILGVDAVAAQPKVAIVQCLGDCAVQKKKFDYKGVQTCQGSKMLFGGEGACAFGCVGYGDCALACPSDAICMESGLARISTPLCTGCGLCVKACPSNLISMVSADICVCVACQNTEKGAVVRKKCSAGCIACRKCVKECPEQAIVMENNLAVIDQEKCSCCGHCAEICMTKCIQLTGVKQNVLVEV